MKKFIFMVAFATGSLLIASTATAKEEMLIVTGDNESKWMKADGGTWLGADKTWYKLNTKDATLWMSKDGKEWMSATNGMWQDKEGKWLKIDMKVLKWSADGGKTWVEVPDWKWEAPDGTWYKFDKDWTVWSMKGKM